MKFLMMAVLAMSFFSANAQSNEELRQEELIYVSKVFAPSGFDDNDKVEVIVKGHLPNPCWRYPKAIVKQVGNQISLDIVAANEENPLRVCPEVVVPYLLVVDLGILSSKTYHIEAKGSNNTSTAKMFVAVSAQQAMDDYLYAHLTRLERIKGTRLVHIHGLHPSDCLQISDVKFISNKLDTYSILPIVKPISNFCPKKMQPFIYEVEVPNEFNLDELLLHVRSMEGRSHNLLFKN